MAKRVVKKVLKKRGRPKGSKNKPKDSKDIELVSKKVLKKSTKPNKPKTVKEVQDKNYMENVIISKVLGYCPKCGSILCSTDLESPRIFVCVTCGKRARTNKIKQKSKKYEDKEYSNKKEYLQDVIQSDHVDMPSTKEVTPDEFKVDSN